MGQADEFLKSFFENYPKWESGQFTLDELNKCLQEYQEQLNNRPLEDFDGLSPAQMFVL